MRKLLLLLAVLVTSYQTGLCDSISLTVGDLCFSIEGDEATCGGYSEGSVPGDTIKIPSHVEYNGKEYPVTEISFWGFYGSDISRVSTLILPNTLVRIWGSAFNGGGFTSLEIPESVKYLCGFAQCKNLKEIKIPKSVEKIGRGAFSGCTGLTKAVIEAEVDTIPASMFVQCYNLQEVILPPTVKVIDGGIYGSGAFYECNNLKQINLPESLTSIGIEAFYHVGLESVAIPASVTEIGAGAFAGCRNLKSVNIPENMTVLDYGIFENCTSLESIRIPDKVTAINGVYSWGGGCFGGCTSLKNVVFGKSLKTIGAGAFRQCESLTEINLAAPIDSVGEGAFNYCKNLRTVTIGSALTKLPTSLFAGCESVEAFILDGDNPGFSSVDGCIYDRAKTRIIMVPAMLKGSLSIPEGVTQIDPDAFNSCKNLTEIKLPGSLEEIGERAFANSGIESLHIPASVNKIGKQFCSGSRLKSITVDPANKTYSSLDGSLYDHAKSLLISAPPRLEGLLTLPASVRTLGSLSLYQCKSLTDIKFNDGLKKIEGSALRECTSLTSLSIPESVAEIGEYAFYGCTGLREIKFPDLLKKFSGAVCDGCESLEKFNFPSALDNIGFCAFRNCALKDLEIPATVKYLGGNAFSSNSLLRKVSILGEPKFDYQVFEYCNAIDSVCCYSLTPPDAGWTPFGSGGEVYQNATLYVYDEATEAYRNANGWQRFLNIRNFPDDNNRVLEIEIVRPGENWWTGPTIAGDLTEKMVPGVKYTLSLRIKGSKAAEGENSLLIMRPGNFSPTDIIDVSTEWQTVTKEIILEQEMWNSRLEIMSGNYDGKLWIDDVVLTRENSDENLVVNGTFDEDRTKGWTVWENGDSSATITAVVDNGETSSVPTISVPVEENRWIVYDFSGRLVLDTRDCRQLSDLPAGLYIINGKKILKR